MNKMILLGICSILFFFSRVSAETSDWNLKQNEFGTSVETIGTAEINELRVQAVLRFDCNKNGAFLKFEIDDFDKAQNIFDLRIFEGPAAPTRALTLTTIELEGVSPVQSVSFRQNGFISMGGRFVIEISQVQDNSFVLGQLYRRMATEGAFFRIRITSYRDPKQFIIAEFPLNNSKEAITALAAACPNLKSQPRKPAKGR